MQELMISGRRYISSSSAAKEHGYHSDYIGQLIRGGKVRGQKVGRAWYVDAESLAVYLGKKISEVQAEASAAAVETPAQEMPQPEKETIEEKEAVVPEPAAKPAAPRVQEEEKPAAMLQPEVLPEPEEHPVAIRTPQMRQASQRVAHVSVAQEISREEIVPKKTSGLVYVTDESPLLPELKKGYVDMSKHGSAQTKVDVPVRIHVERNEWSAHRTKRLAAQSAVLAGIGLFVLAAVAMAGSLLVYDIASDGTAQAASVRFSLPN